MMLVCPQCQYENPDTNKFCQRCGTSLSYQICPNCSAEVAWNALNCPQCDTSTAHVHWAIISESLSSSISVEETVESTPSEIETSVATIAEGEEVDFTPSEIETSVVEEEDYSDLPPESIQVEYLDSQQRYQILSIEAEEVVEATNSPQRIRQAKVADLSPLQQPEIITIQSQEPLKAETFLSAIAQPYFTLQKSLYNVIPPLKDAWEEENKTVVIIEDRSEWTRLKDFWQGEAVPLLQILHELNIMVQLWEELSALGYCQSLLKVDNLRIDEDQSLCLQQLYADAANSSPTLIELGHSWQELLASLEDKPYEPLLSLVQFMVNGEIESTTQLQIHLAQIAQDVPETEDNMITQSSSNTKIDPPEGDEMDLPTVLLPMQILSLTHAGLTDVGLQREHNEDYFGIYTHTDYEETPFSTNIHAKGLYIVCDGMGGHAAGEVASKMTEESLRKYFQTHWEDELPNYSTILEGTYLANQTVYEVNQQNASSGSGRMGTTLVMTLIQNTKVAIAHVGDSRVYSYTRKRGLEQLTIDHEVGQREIQRGVSPEIAYARSDAYQLTQAIGPRDNTFVRPDIHFLDLTEDTLLLLCSDGLCDHDLLEENYLTYIAPLISSRANLEQGVQKLIDFANQYNGHDNITAVVVRIKVRPGMEQGSLL